MDVLVFQLQHNRYAVPADSVVEVVRAVAIVPIAGAPRAVEGVFSLRGRVVPVVDIRARLGLRGAALDPSQHFIVVRVGDRPTALRVDRVDTLTAIDEKQINPSGQSIPAAQNVAGIATVGDDLIVIYDVEAFLSQAEAELLGPLLDEMTTAGGIQ